MIKRREPDHAFSSRKKILRTKCLELNRGKGFLNKVIFEVWHIFRIIKQHEHTWNIHTHIHTWNNKKHLIESIIYTLVIKWFLFKTMLRICFGSWIIYSTGLGNGIRCVKTVLKTFFSVVKILPIKRVIKSGNLILATKLIRFHISFCLDNPKIAKHVNNVLR